MLNYNGLFIYHNAINNSFDLFDSSCLIGNYKTMRGAKIAATAYLKKHYNGNNAQSAYYN